MSPCKAAAPADIRGGGLGQDCSRPSRPYSINTPVALQVPKRGRWCTVAKVVPLDGVPVLAIAVRHQRGTARVVSIPVAVLDFAQRAGCCWFVWRNDRKLEMRRITLADLWRQGWLRGGEVYLPLTAMELVPWRAWAFATQVVRLNQERPTPTQLPLPLEGA